jgi:hypothetical protein
LSLFGVAYGNPKRAEGPPENQTARKRAETSALFRFNPFSSQNGLYSALVPNIELRFSARVDSALSTIEKQSENLIYSRQRYRFTPSLRIAQTILSILHIFAVFSSKFPHNFLINYQ